MFGDRMEKSGFEMRKVFVQTATMRFVMGKRSGAGGTQIDSGRFSKW